MTLQRVESKTVQTRNIWEGHRPNKTREKNSTQADCWFGATHSTKKSSTKISTSLNCKNISVQTKHPICCPLKVLLISYREVLSIIPKERDKYSWAWFKVTWQPEDLLFIKSYSKSYNGIDIKKIKGMQDFYIFKFICWGFMMSNYN